MKMRKYFHDLYLKFDVLLFADLFEKFRNGGLENCGLLLSHYMLSMTKVELELISDADIYLFSKNLMTQNNSQAYTQMQIVYD